MITMANDVVWMGAWQNDHDWHYEIVVSYPDYISYGADWEDFTNGQGWQKAMKMGSGKVVSCDSPRVYHRAQRGHQPGAKMSNG